MVDVACGLNYAIARFLDGTVSGCGQRIYNQLGLSNGFATVTSFTRRPRQRHLVVQVASQHSHTFLLLEDGSLTASGLNYYGELGLGTTGQQLLACVPSPGAVACVVCGYYCSFLLLEDGRLFACGDNAFGMLGLGDSKKRELFTYVPLPYPVARVARGIGHTVILSEEGTLASCGSNKYGQLGLGDTVERTSFVRLPTSGVVRQVACYGDQTFILFEGGRLEACGHNYLGQLGLGDTANRSVLTRVPAPPVAQVAASIAHSLVVLMDGSCAGCAVVTWTESWGWPTSMRYSTHSRGWRCDYATLEVTYLLFIAWVRYVMSLPTVVHLKRKGGVVVQDCDVYIGRACNMGGWRLPQSYWYNPYSVKQYGRDDALRRYREYVVQLPNFKERLAELGGKRLGCWCSPEPCHGDILVELYRVTALN